MVSFDLSGLATTLGEMERRCAKALGAEVPPPSTETGKRVFHAYPHQVTLRMVFFAAVVLVVVSVNVVWHAVLAMPPAPPVPPAPKPEWRPPGEMVRVVDFSEDELTGVASGRMHELVFVISDSVRGAMGRLGTVCGTPWLEHASVGGDAPPMPESAVTLRNMLVVRGERAPMLNPRIVDAAGEKMLLATAPFRYQHERASRAYAKIVTVAHHGGTYTSRTPDEAFCIQELLPAPR